MIHYFGQDEIRTFEDGKRLVKIGICARCLEPTTLDSSCCGEPLMINGAWEKEESENG